MNEASIYLPVTRRHQGLTFVAIHDGTHVCEYGICPELLPIDEVEVWVHEFSERSIHLAISTDSEFNMKIPISLSLIPNKCLFRVQHLMVSLHTRSIIRIEDEAGKTKDRILLTPRQFEEMIIFQTHIP